MVGILIAGATILKFVLRLYLALETWEINAVASLLQQTSLHVDETSLRVDKKNHWIHVTQQERLRLNFCIEDRARKRFFH